MYADIVVLTYQAPDIETFTYEIPKQLEKEVKVGQLVSVPFGKRNPTGVVISVRDSIAEFIPNKKEILRSAQNDRSEGLQNDIQIKPIGSILLTQPILLPYQIKLLDWMSDYYFAPMVNCLGAMLPDIPKRLVNTGFNPVRGSTGLNPEQTMVLVPSINQLPQIIAAHKAKSFVVYHSELKTSERFATWQKISDGSIDYVFGTRSAIFTPCPSLKQITIYDEHDGAYKDERSPYFDTLTVAEKLTQLTKANLKIIDSSPRVTTYFNHKSTGITPASNSTGVIPVRIVNMLDEKKMGNYSPISTLLENYIKKGLAKNKRILLFLNKKAESGHVYCKNCKYSDFAKSQPETCPDCGSADIYFNSTNVKSLAQLVKKIVPHAAVHIIAQNSESDPDQPAQRIDIATAAVFYSQKSSAYKLLIKKYDLVAHIFADSLLNITDFSSAEKLFAQIANLKKLTKGLLLIQTYNAQDPTVIAAANGNYQMFFQNQLSERKALSYPPFSLLIKLTTKGKKEERLEEKAQGLYEELNRSVVSSQLSNVSALGPYKPIFSSKISKYNIILKVVTNSYLLEDREKALEKATPLLTNVPKDWRVEIEPDSLN